MGLKLGVLGLFENPFDLRILWWRYNIKGGEQPRERGGQKQEFGFEQRAAAAAIFRLPWLILFLLLLTIQVCLANFLTLRLRMKSYSIK